MAAQHEESPGKSSRQRRAPMACDFCRNRKMKCDNKRPECRNCKEHGKSCVYAELAKRPRPSFARINELEQDNQRLQERIAALSLRTASSGSCNSSRRIDSTEVIHGCQVDALATSCGRDASFGQNPDAAMLTPASSSSTTPKASFSPDKESSYHGPTSDLFDEKSSEDQIRTHESSSRVPDMWVKRQLIAESASQRQLETVNILAGKLDFDGVDPDLGMHLISIYWSRQQSFGPVVYRTAFMRDMACTGPYFSKFLLNAIYHYACKYTDRPEVRRDPGNVLTAGYMFRQRATELLRSNYDVSNITTAQGLLIMSSALFSWCDEKSTSWLYAGMAFNMVVDLGVHVRPGMLKQALSDEDLEIRRRLLWSAYVIDKLQSLYQGRPAYFHDHHTDIPVLFLDDHEELELFNALSYTGLDSNYKTPVYSISVFTQTCKLSIILDKILNSLYTAKSNSKDPSDLFLESQAIQKELEGWRTALPVHVTLDPSRKIQLPHSLALLAFYNVVTILLHRPFVSDGHLQTISHDVALNAFSTCSAAAFEIDHMLKTYEQSYYPHTTPYIISYAVYVSGTIHVRLAAQLQPGSDAHQAIGRCLKVLELQSAMCWSPRRARRVLLSLVSRLGIVLQEELVDADLTAEYDLNIDAIIESFNREASQRQNVSHLAPPGLANPITGAVIADDGYSQAAYMATNFGGINQQHPSPLETHDFDFLYDPIFGFNGTAFDDLDYNMEDCTRNF